MDKTADGASIIIGTFENVNKANDALRSLQKAIEKKEGWDAIFYMNNNPDDISYGYD